jgi:Tol biopolymer transport system component
VDAGTLAPPDCALAEFGEPEAVADVAPGLNIWSPALSTDAQTLYFAASPPGASETIYRAQRIADDAFAEPTPLENVSVAAGEGTPFPSADHLALYFYATRAGSAGDRDLWVASRSTLTSEFDDPRPIEGLDSPAIEHLPWLSSDELTLVFVSSRAGGLGQSDLWTTTRSTRDARFEPPRPLPGINTPLDEGRASLTADRLSLIFSSARDGTLGDHDLWIATRTDPDGPFGPPTNLTHLNSTTRDIDPFLTANERELFYVSTRTGRSQLLRAVRCAE